MSFLLTRAAYDQGVICPVVCIIRNVKISEKSSAVYDKMIDALMEKINKIQEEVLPSDEVQGFRELYKGIKSKVTPAGENFLKGCLRRGEFRRYNNIVDAYNTLTLETVTPFGMHDASKLIANGTLVFKRAEGTEQMVPSFSKKVYKLRKGDFTYGINTKDGFSPFAWLGKKDKDNSEYQVQDSTTDLLFTAIGNRVTTTQRNIDLCKEVFKRIQMSCPDARLQILKPTLVESVEKVSRFSSSSSQKEPERVDDEAKVEEAVV